MVHSHGWIVMLLLETSVFPHKGFFTGLLECHPDMAYGFPKRDRAQRTRGKLYHQFLDILLAEGNPIRCRRGLHKGLNIKKQRSLGAITTRNGYSLIVGGQIYCSILIEMNSSDSENEWIRTTLKDWKNFPKQYWMNN